MIVVRAVQHFVSSKCSAPIPYRYETQRLALIRATLDSDYFAIGPVPLAISEAHACGSASCVAAVRTGDGSPAILCITGDANPRISGWNGPTVVFSPADLWAEPLAGNLRAVWSCSRRWVAPGDQVRVLHTLDENGSTALIDVAQAVTASSDGVAIVLAMACKGLVEIDLDDAPLAPSTRVRRIEA